MAVSYKVKKTTPVFPGVVFCFYYEESVNWLTRCFKPAASAESCSLAEAPSSAVALLL